MRFTVLVADDEPHILDVVRAYLERDGYVTLAARSGETALSVARAETPDLLVLDVMLPDMSGFDVLRTLRRESPGTAVVMLTARDDVIDRVAGLELGADDYVVKPFEPRELVARVGAVLRRMARERQPSDEGAADGSEIEGAAGSPLSLFDLSIDRPFREVTRGGDILSLTRTEFDLLVAFAEQPGRVWTREQIGARIFGEAFDTYDRTIDSHISNLRHKLGVRRDGGQYVETVRGVGYRAAASLQRLDAAAGR